MNSNIYPENPLCNWNQFYKVINYCNEVIKFAPAVQDLDPSFNDFILKGYLAEAYFLRSLSYFYLVRIFKDVPLVLEPSSDDEVDFYIPKTDGSEVLRNISQDLIAYRDFASADDFITYEEKKGRASKAAIDALLADIALWEFKYEECLEHIERIEASGQFRLLPRTSLFYLFYPGSSVESIFEFQFDNGRGQNNSMYDLTQVNALQYDPSQYAADLFNPVSSGEWVRGEGVSIRTYSPGDYVIWKYVGRMPDAKTVRTGSDQKSCNWIVYRYAEVLLMKAEALSQLGRFTEALEALNHVRKRANVPVLTLKGNITEFEDAILDERARELAFEGKRWFDLVRMGRRNDFSQKDKLIGIIIQNIPSIQKKYQALKLTNPMGWYFPIFDDELERNKALVQNPYYEF